MNSIDNDIPIKKMCSKCRETKPLDDFRKSKTGKYGRHGFCKACHSNDSRLKYEGNKDIRLGQIEHWNDANPHKMWKYNLKYREKKLREKRRLRRNLKNRPELLTPEDIEKIDDGFVPDF